jgi:hypothetical protein
MELFKPIPGHFGYEVSDHGTARSLNRTVAVRRQNGSTFDRPLQGRILKPLAHPQGYLAINLGTGPRLLLHRVVLLAFVGPAEGLWVNHKNGIKTDNRLENLEYCKPKWNSEHAVHTGLQSGPPGSGKLTAEQVIEIDRRHKGGESGASLAREFGVMKEMVYSIAKGRSWQWLTGNDEPLTASKLTPEDRLQIKALLAEGRTGRELALLYSVTPSTISCIKNGRRSYGN